MIQEWKDRRRVRLTSHMAQTTTEEGMRVGLFCINVTNTGQRDIEITHVWIASSPPVFFDNTQRPLPRRLGDQESWTTWVELVSVQGMVIKEDQARIRLSTGTVLCAVKESTMPQVGSVAGGRAQIAAVKKVG